MTFMTTTRRASAAVAAIAGALVLSSCSVYDIPLPGGADTGSDPVTVHVKFRDVLDLVPQSTVKVDEEKGKKLITLGGSPSLKSLVGGLNALGVTPRDMISILQAVKAAGALQADIEVM